MFEDIIPILNTKTYIPALSTEYELRFCKIEEIEELIVFIRDYWKENHIFVLSRELFEWQHLDKENNRVNYIIAKNRKSGEIHSILGFVPTSQFDKNIKNTEVWPCIWKVKDDIHVKGLGISLYYYLKENIKIETISILGISEIALCIYKSWDFETGKIEHYFILNNRLTDYKLIKYRDKIQDAIKVDTTSRLQMKRIEDDNLYETLNKMEMPRYKSATYYINRFVNHPIYKYKAYGFLEDGIYKAIMFVRTCSNQNAKALRIVDYVGEKDAIQGMRDYFLHLLYKEKAEYIDFIVVGWEQTNLEKAGFIKKSTDKIIIPNYYEPFEMLNIELDYAYKTILTENEKIFYKADADQDRPNVIVS